MGTAPHKCQPRINCALPLSALYFAHLPTAKTGKKTANASLIGGLDFVALNFWFSPLDSAAQGDIINLNNKPNLCLLFK